MKHTTHIVHENSFTNSLDGVIPSTTPSVFKNHIHLYPVIAVTLFPLFLNHSIG